ncbi:hypothetical protein NDA03_00525 [Trichocoleus sp. Lan]
MPEDSRTLTHRGLGYRCLDCGCLGTVRAIAIDLWQRLRAVLAVLDVKTR